MKAMNILLGYSQGGHFDTKRFDLFDEEDHDEEESASGWRSNLIFGV